MSAGEPSIRIDSHHHFWDVESGEYDWPTPAEAVIHRTFAAGDLEPELAAARIDRTVLVQTVNTIRDTESMLAAAAIGAHETPGHAGPVEAMAIGNILVQARAAGAVEGGLDELRRLVRETHKVSTYPV